MPPRRSFGTEISGNRQRNQEFSPEARAAMLAMLDTGCSARRVAREFRTTHSTVLQTKKRWLESHKVTSRPRKGRPMKLSSTAQRYIIRMASQDRQISYNALLDATPNRVSRRTIRRLLRKHWGRKWKAIKRPKLDSESAAQRLSFAMYWISNTPELEAVRCIEIDDANTPAYMTRRSSQMRFLYVINQIIRTSTSSDFRMKNISKNSSISQTT